MWFIFDGLGILLSLLTWGLLAFADWVVVRQVFFAWFWAAHPRFSWMPFTDSGAVLFLVYQSLICLSFVSHIRAATTDPGTVRQTSTPPVLKNPRFCKLCQGRWKPPRAHHCKTCHRCIFRMDHHCPWINNCVGLSNQKLFILFLMYTAASAIMSLVLLVSSAVYWLWSQKSWLDAAPPTGTALFCSGIVAVECLAAVLFVVDFLQEQIESICMNSTLVETYQRTHGNRTTFDEHFKTVFGQCWWVWPWPFPSAPPPEYTEPAIPDEADPATWDEGSDCLGIAGEESESLGAFTQSGHPSAHGDARLRSKIPAENPVDD